SDQAAGRGLRSTIAFIRGNLAPHGAIVKSTAIESSFIGSDGVYRLTGPVRLFTSERMAIQALKDQGPGRIKSGEILVLIGRGPLGAGMEETYQLTSALKYLDVGKTVALITDARFSGLSTGPCIGHVEPEALAGGPIGRLRDGDRVRVVIDCKNLDGRIDLVTPDPVGGEDVPVDAELAHRTPSADLVADPALPADTRLWAALQNASGGTWGGAVYDP